MSDDHEQVRNAACGYAKSCSPLGDVARWALALDKRVCELEAILDEMGQVRDDAVGHVDAARKYAIEQRDAAIARAEKAEAERDALMSPGMIEGMRRACLLKKGVTAEDVLEHLRRIASSYEDEEAERRAEVARLREALGCNPDRLRVRDIEGTGPVLEVYVRNDDLKGWHWDWLSTLNTEQAATWRAALEPKP